MDFLIGNPASYRGYRAVARIVGLACLFLVRSAVAQAPVALRLVTADQPERLLCSQLEDFRYSPFGGLIATNWVSGVTIGDRALFRERDRHAIEPSITVDSFMQGPADTVAEGLLAEFDAEFEEERQEMAARMGLLRAADSVDARYDGKRFEQLGAHREIGPRFVRHAHQEVEIRRGDVLKPGDISLTPGGVGSEHVRMRPDQVEVDVYAVRIEAVRSDAPARRVAFEPQLRWGRQDILQDMRAEHSPALPVGPPPDVLDDKGRPRRFFELNLYLLPTLHAEGRSGTPYSLDGVRFHLGRNGIEIEEDSARLRVTGPFSLQLVLPPVAQPAAPRAMPVYEDPASGMRYTFGIPPADTTRDGVLRLTVTASRAAVTLPAPSDLALTLEPFPGPSQPAAETPVRHVRGDADGNYAVAVGDLDAGLYRVRVPELLPPSARYDVIVCVAKPSTRGAVSLFTHRNRNDYRQGETIEVTAVLRAVAAVEDARVELALFGEGVPTVSLGTLTVGAPAGGSATRFVSIPAAHLQPGRYVLDARSADDALIVHRMAFTVYQEALRTTWEAVSSRITEIGPFRNSEGLISHHTMRNSPVETLRDRDEHERYTGQDAMPEAAQSLCRTDPLFPVPEATARYDEREQTLAAAMRFGTRHMPEFSWGLGGQSAWNPMHTYPESLDWMRRMVALRTQIYREFASFGGFFLNWYPGLGSHYEAHPPSDGFGSLQVDALNRAVREAQGPLPEPWTWTREHGLHMRQDDDTIIKESDLLANGLEHPLFNSPAMQELVEWKLRGQRRRTAGFSKSYAAWTEVARGLGDWNYLSFVPVGWFRSPNYYPPIYYEGLPRTGIHAYTDWQADPFMEIYGIDYYGANSGSPPWVQGFSGRRNMHIRQTFLAAARGAWGTGFDASAMMPEGRHGEDLRLIGDLMHRYGPYFMTLRPRSRVAIVRSFHQEAADTGPYRGSGGRNGMVWLNQGIQGEQYTLYYNLLRSGYAAAFITEEQIAAGELDRHQAVFLHRQRLVMPPALMQRFDDYVAGGGRIFKDPLSAPDYPGEVVNVSADSEVITHVGSSGHPIGQRYLWMLHNYYQCKDRLEAVLDTLPQPEVQSDHHHIVHAALEGRDTAALFVINDTMVPPSVHTAESGWFIQGWTLARQGTLFFDQPYYVYDVTEGGLETRLNDVSSARPGTFEYPVDFRQSEGRILVMTERPIRAVELSATLVGRPEGNALRLDLAVLDDAGHPFADALPFEIALFDPDDREVVQMYRAAGPSQPVEIAMGRNLRPGAWRIVAREQVNGRTVEAVLTVADGAPVVAADWQGNGRILARRPAEIAGFLRDKQALTIVLDEGQSETVRQAAVELAQVLRDAGKECDVFEIDPVQVHDLPLRWRRNDYDERIWQDVTAGNLIAVRRGLSTLSSQDWVYYDHPRSGYQQPGPQVAIFRDVILIGTPRDNRLLADLHGLVGRSASDQAPGHDAALLQVVHDGFAPRFDVLSVQAEAAAGLSAASAWIRAQLAADSAPPAEASVLATATATAATKQMPLPNVQREGFGNPVDVRHMGDGRLLVSARYSYNFSGSVHFMLDAATGEVRDEFPDVRGSLSALGSDQFVERLGGRTVFRDTDMAPVWQLHADVLQHGPTGNMVHLDGDRITRLDSHGATLWSRRFDEDIRRPTDFLRPWQVTAQAISANGDRLLLSSYRQVMYGSIVSAYVDGAIQMLDAHTGATVWRHDGIMVRGTVCRFVGDDIVAGHRGANDAALVVLDMNGTRLRWMPVDAPVVGIQPLGGDLALIEKEGSGGFSVFDLAAGTERELPVTGAVKGGWLDRGAFEIGAWDRMLHRFDAALNRVRSVRLPSQAGTVIPDPAGEGLIVGTDSGHVLWLDGHGDVTRSVDMNVFNVVRSEAHWADRHTAKVLADVPARQVEFVVGRPVGLLDRLASYADVSDNLLVNGAFDDGARGWDSDAEAQWADGLADGRALGLGGRIGQSVVCEPGRTYVLSLFQQGPANLSLRLTVDYAGSETGFSAVLPLSTRWEERTASFRPPKGATEARLGLTLMGGEDMSPERRRALIDSVAVARVRFRSPNLLLQTTEELAGGGLDRLNARANIVGDLFRAKPPELKQVVPWVGHLAKASYQSEQPPPAVTPWTVMVDGQVTGQETSWFRGPLPQGIWSDHARLEMQFDRPSELNVVAIYHDNAAPNRYTRRFAVFAQTRDGWRLLGLEAGNRSPYTVFAFDTIEANKLVYYWGGSPDGHVRIAEIEAYRATEDIADLF